MDRDGNAVAGGKRPLSSMTPTLVLKDGRAWLATGSPGGSQIITTVLQMLVNVIEASDAMGSLQSVIRRDSLFRGASDPRRPQAGSAGAAMREALN